MKLELTVKNGLTKDGAKSTHTTCPRTANPLADSVNII